MKEIPVVIAFTQNYIVPACTTLQSILSNSRESRFHIICLLTEPLSSHNQLTIQKFDSERIRFTFINLDGKLDGIYIDHRYTIAASYRLLLPDILPMYDKVIYTDCDIIFQNDLSQIYSNIQLGDNYLAGVLEAPLDFQIPYINSIGCDPQYYMNSGFLIMNLRLMREDNLVSKFIEASKVEYLQFPDQDVLNMICKGRILALSPYMNSIRTFFIPSYKYDFLKRYSKNDLEDILAKGNIHYTGGKPWNEYTLKFESWWKYYFLLPNSIKRLGHVNTKLFWLGKVSNTVIGQLLIKSIQQVYRKFKSKQS